MKKVVFLGLGYIGLPTAAVAASHGYEVVGVDVNQSVVDTVNQGKIHIIEHDLDKIVKEVLAKEPPCSDPPRAGRCFLHRRPHSFQAEPSGRHHLCGGCHTVGHSLSAAGQPVRHRVDIACAYHGENGRAHLHRTSRIEGKDIYGILSRARAAGEHPL
jgi:threonine dehydrogenase-like Zn-dependent dehydrogenase